VVLKARVGYAFTVLVREYGMKQAVLVEVVEFGQRREQP